MYYLFKPTLNLFDIIWIVSLAWLTAIIDMHWLYYVMIIPMSIMSYSLTTKFVK